MIDNEIKMGMVQGTVSTPRSVEDQYLKYGES